MVDLSNCDFKPLSVKIVKPEESFINAYVNECLGSEGDISSTRIMRRILDAKHNKADLNKVMSNKCQHLSPKEGEKIFNLCVTLNICSMEH